MFLSFHGTYTPAHLRFASLDGNSVRYTGDPIHGTLLPLSVTVFSTTLCMAGVPAHLKHLYRGHSGNRFKVKRATNSNPQLLAPAGNLTIMVCDLYQAAIKQVDAQPSQLRLGRQSSHHRCIRPSVWARRSLGLSSLNRLHLLSDKEEAIQQNLQTTMEFAYPPLPNPPPPKAPASKRPVLGPYSSPKVRASADIARLAEHWNLHYGRAFVRKIAEWSIFYAAGQTVTLVRVGKGQRHDIFLSCPNKIPCYAEVSSACFWADVYSVCG